MIRLVNILALAFTVMFSFALYKLKHTTSEAVTQLDSLEQQIMSEEQALHILRAEWSHLNKTARLERLANKYLALQPADPGQIVRVEDLQFRPLDLDGLEDDAVGTVSIVPQEEELVHEDLRLTDRTIVTPMTKPQLSTRGGDARG